MNYKRVVYHVLILLFLANNGFASDERRLNEGE